MRVFMGVGLGYVTTFSNQTLDFDLVTMGGVGADYLAHVHCRHIGLSKGRRAGFHAGHRKRRHQLRRNGHGNDGGERRRRRRRRSLQDCGVAMSNDKDETAKTYAEIWGEAIHSNRHLRVLVDGLGRALPFAGNYHHPAVIG